MASAPLAVDSPSLWWNRPLWWNRRAPLAALTAMLVAVQAWQVVYREFDPDELEHLHAAFLIAEGDVPYRDFFEHHPPALYLLLQPIFWLFGPQFATITAARTLMLAFSWGTLLITAVLAWRALGVGLFDPAAATGAETRSAEFDFGWTVALLLAACTTFWMKGIEVRPDVPALFFLMTAACIAWPKPVCDRSDSGPFSWSQWMVVGLFCGGATLFTPKAVIPAVAISIAGALWPKQGRFDLRPVVSVAFWGAYCWGFAFVGMFLWSGSWQPFLDSVVGLHFRWNVSTPMLLHLRPTLVENAAVWLGAGVAGLLMVRGLFRPKSSRDEMTVVSRRTVLVASLCAASLPGVRAAFPQFYFLWTPFLVLAALAGWTHCLQHLRPTYRIGLTITFLIGGVLLISRAIVQRRNGGLAGLFGTIFDESAGSLTVRWNISIAALLLTTVLLAALLAWFVATVPRRAVWVCLLAGLLYGWCRNIDTVLRTNAYQCERIRRVNELVAARNRMPTDACDTVFDGFTGYGVFRQHAFDLWWLNEYSARLPADGHPRLPMREMELVRTERGHNPSSMPSVIVRWAGDDVETSFRAPRVVIYDSELQRHLPQSIREWIESEYVPDALQPILHHRSKQ